MKRAFMWSSRRWLLLLLAAAAVTLAGGASRAADVPPEPTSVTARLIADSSAPLSSARLTQSAITWVGGSTTASTGESVTVYVSAALPTELGTPQTWADFLAGLVHGPELAALTTYIAAFDEMQEVCGSRALGCYGANRMISMGETRFGVTAAEVVRHEYGHHIAFHRANVPWVAIDWGPKNWSSAVDVCRRADARTAYPGDEGDHYALNPGEAWAETYRLLDERKAGAVGSGWQIIDESFYPSETALQAAERDVVQPWTAGRRQVLRRTFTKGGAPTWLLPLATPLDGILDVQVRLPRGGLHEVELVTSDRKTVLQKGPWSSTTMKTLTRTLCGERAVFLRVTRKGAFGRVTVTATTP
ncbi:MAG TPA: hypothetical protein VFN06_04540 [Gaiellaceae bacterium]|nr:hypothetical protein [Gaiellaceae bacterium]